MDEDDNVCKIAYFVPTTEPSVHIQLTTYRLTAGFKLQNYAPIVLKKVKFYAAKSKQIYEEAWLFMEKSNLYIHIT